MKYYIETAETLREATQRECEIIDFCRQLGEEVEVAGFETTILDENLEELSSKVIGSRWSNYWSMKSHYTSDPSKKGVESNYYFDYYTLLSEEEKTRFWAWVHGKYQLPRILRWHTAGCKEINYLLGIWAMPTEEDLNKLEPIPEDAEWFK